MNFTLPTVTGRMEMTHADFQHACAVAIADLQERVTPDNSLIHLLCEAIRCSREACEMAALQKADVEEQRALEKHYREEPGVKP